MELHQNILSCIGSDDLVFDVGAHIGVRTKQFLSRTDNVICIEPQPECAAVLREKYAANSSVIILEAGLDSIQGQREISICSNQNMLSTFSEDWQNGRYSGFTWDKTETVEMITFDHVVERYGRPRYCKINVQGFDLNVINGMHKAVDYLSFECAAEFIAKDVSCIENLVDLGYTAFNLYAGGKEIFYYRRWVSAEKLIEDIQIKAKENSGFWGHVFAHCGTEHPDKDTQYIDLAASQYTKSALELFKARSLLPKDPVIVAVGLTPLVWSSSTKDLFPESKQHNVSLDELALLSELESGLGQHLSEYRHIHLLHINAEGHELEVLRSLTSHIRHARIDCIHFQYGPRQQSSGMTMQSLFNFFKDHEYELMCMAPGEMILCDHWERKLCDGHYEDFIAIHRRLRPLLLNEPKVMLDLADLCKRYNLIPKGVIHVGAHVGKELSAYQDMGVPKVLFVEANPQVFEVLKLNTENHPNVTLANVAISNKSGKINLHVTSMDQSSSILPLKGHRDIYPSIVETHIVNVPAETLDGLLVRMEQPAEDFNILNIDIQGAELLALEGAKNQLQYISAINTEINFEELYENSAQVEDLDNFLEPYGFVRVITTCPFHTSWGDAFYIKKEFLSVC